MGLDQYLTAERKVDSLPSRVQEKLAAAIGEGENKLYLSAYDFNSDADEKADYHAALDAAVLTEFRDPQNSPSLYVIGDGSGALIQATVGYWRKANQIHAWFVRECQNGVDECQVSDPISRDKLRELLGLCQKVLGLGEMVADKVCAGYASTPEQPEFHKVLEDGEVMANPTLAAQLLPSQSGFFFGSTDYDQYYVEDLKLTVAHLERVLQAPEDTVFRYHSSW